MIHGSEVRVAKFNRFAVGSLKYFRCCCCCLLWCVRACVRACVCVCVCDIRGATVSEPLDCTRCLFVVFLESAVCCTRLCVPIYECVLSVLLELMKVTVNFLVVWRYV